MIDLRSDTITVPSDAMRAAMMAAAVGDDLFGEDPSCNELETEVARILGKEAALFTPSGTMANQIAIHLLSRPGDSVLTEEQSHCFLYEAGGAAALSGVQFDFVPLKARLDPQALRAAIRSDNLNSSPTTLLVIENTHNKGGGRALPAKIVANAAEVGRQFGLQVHCDGARLWNAAAALACDPQLLAAPFTTIAVCFSKGLGAPVGSALCGPKTLIEKGRKIRKRWGAGMRQSGFLAAGALFALRNNRERLRDDHRRLHYLRTELAAAERAGKPIVVMPLPHEEDVATNILYFRVGDRANQGYGLGSAVALELQQRGDQFRQHIEERGVRMFHLGGGWLRAVTHLHIDDAAIEQTAATIIAAL